MLRASLIYLSKASWAKNIAANWSLAWRAASRFVAGETLEEAIEVVNVLNTKGINATLDHLGEHTTSPAIAKKATEDILELLTAIEASGLRCNISIKLTQIGLALDEKLCDDNVARIITYAKELGNFVRIDMEDSPWVDSTLDLVYSMRKDHGLTNTGVVIQSYLYRSKQDIQSLMGDATPIRLCKGAYKETPDVAFPKKIDVDKNFDSLTEDIFEFSSGLGAPEISTDGKIPPLAAIATHDPKRVDFAKAFANKIGLPNSALEFQMLFGIRRDLQEELRELGYPVRVYVPYGTDWYPYFVRRLAESPANLWFFLSNYFRE
jgi:proline dehydrogenase